jgi:acetoin utilization protein AcuC
VSVVVDERLASYNFGPSHPMSPIRIQLAYRLAREFGLLDLPNVSIIDSVVPCTDEELLSVHTPEFIRSVKLAGRHGLVNDPRTGIGTEDVPIFPEMHEATALICGATLQSVKEVYYGRTQHSVNLAGGLHHAMPDRAAGFCVYNDVAVGIKWLLDQGVKRVAYVDVDVHHGDGVQECFWDDPRVMTISIHESGRTLFPGTGYPDEIGGPNAIGTAANVALPPGVADNEWLRAFQAIVPPLLEEFMPQYLVTQHGCDSHFDDPLAHMALSIDGQRMAYESLHRLAHRFAGGRWIAVGGGGYEWVDVVPRIWTHLIAEAAGAPLAPQSEIPEAYLAFVQDLMGRPSPTQMTDGRAPWIQSFERHHNPDNLVDRAVMSTRNAVFPHWGLVSDPFGGFDPFGF